MLLNHEMLLNSHQIVSPDFSTFVLFAQKVGPKNSNPRSRGPHHLNRQQPCNNYYPKPNGYPTFKSQQQQTIHSSNASRFSHSPSGFHNNKNMKQQQPHNGTSNFSNTVTPSKLSLANLVGLLAIISVKPTYD